MLLTIFNLISGGVIENIIKFAKTKGTFYYEKVNYRIIPAFAHIC